MSDEGKVILNYVLQNCIFAYNELCKVNIELNDGQRLSSDADVNYLGALDRMLKDYLIIRVAGLFDLDSKKQGVISFKKLFPNNENFKNIKNQKIIKYIICERNNFVAHLNQKHYIEKDFPDTAKICNSNLRELLNKLCELLK